MLRQVALGLALTGMGIYGSTVSSSSAGQWMEKAEANSLFAQRPHSPAFPQHPQNLTCFQSHKASQQGSP